MCKCLERRRVGRFIEGPWDTSLQPAAELDAKSENRNLPYLRVLLVCTRAMPRHLWLKTWHCEPTHQTTAPCSISLLKRKFTSGFGTFYLSSDKYWLSQFFKQQPLRGKSWFFFSCNNLYKVNACLQWKMEQHINVVIDWQENALLWLMRQMHVAHKSSEEIWSIPYSLLQVFSVGFKFFFYYKQSIYFQL